MTKHSYDKEFKEQAVQYYLDNKDHMTMNEICCPMGLGIIALTWIQKKSSAGLRRSWME